jgi:hypothetical protein
MASWMARYAKIDTNAEAMPALRPSPRPTYAKKAPALVTRWLIAAYPTPNNSSTMPTAR